MIHSHIKPFMLLLLLLLLSFSCLACSKADSPDPVEAELEEPDLPKDATGRYDLSPTGEAIIKDFPTLAVADYSDNARVFYQIFVGSFSDSNGDGIGDLRGVINRFDYLNDGQPDSGLSLGVEGIWLSPIFKSPSYHKYDITDYYAIDPSFGTMEDLIELVQLCHSRDVKLILDLPLNHTGSSNLWFTKFKLAHTEGNTDSEYYDFYCYNDSIRLGNRIFYNIPGTDCCYEGNFSSEMPELNYDNEAVYQAALDIGRYYLTEIGVDGFRFDAAKYVYFGDEPKNVAFWTRYMADLRAINPDIYAVAEVWDSDSVTKTYAPALNCFNFTMAQVDGKISETSKRGNVNIFTHYVESYLNMIHEYNPQAMIIPFIANHDTDRAAGYMTLASGYAKVAANLSLLGPGSPFIYYGEEIGLKGSRGSDNTDANRRLAMLWGDGDTVRNPIGSTFSDSKQTNGTVASTIGDGDSLFNHYKKLIMIRKAHPELAHGTYTALEFKDSRVGGFISTYQGSTICVIHNTCGSAETIDLAPALKALAARSVSTASSTLPDLTSSTFSPASSDSATGPDFDQLEFTSISAVAGIGQASLNGSLLTIDEQTSVILR